MTYEELQEVNLTTKNENELKDLIVEWGKMNKIIENGKDTIQALKLDSEMGEIFQGIIDGDIDEIKDGIGDNLVVIIMVMSILGVEIEIKPKQIYTDTTKNLALKYAIVKGDFSDSLIKGNIEMVEQLALAMIDYLNILAVVHKLSLKECLVQALTDIRPRKGVLLPNGTFVKSTDPEYGKFVSDESNENEKNEKNESNKETSQFRKQKNKKAKK